MLADLLCLSETGVSVRYLFAGGSGARFAAGARVSS